MTNEQMYILIGVPATLALVGILINAAIVSHLSTALNGRMGSLETTMTGRFSTLETAVNGRIGSVESRIASIETRMLSLENTFTTRFDLLMGRLIELEKEIHRK